MSELGAVSEAQELPLEAIPASQAPELRSVSFPMRHRAPLLAAAALGASIAIGWVASGALDSGAGRIASASSARGGAPSRAGVAPSRSAPLRAAAPPASTRVTNDAEAAALFAPHSWHREPPPAPPPPPVPPPPPSAPPFPYAFVGEYTQGGETVYFLSREDRVIDAHVGDHLDGGYVFESADDSQLVFNYVPLNVRQTMAVVQ